MVDVNIGSNNNATDKQLCVTGEMAVSTKTTTPAAIHFYDGGTNTGNMYLGYDGPNLNDNNNYIFFRTPVVALTYWTLPRRCGWYQ